MRRLVPVVLAVSLIALGAGGVAILMGRDGDECPKLGDVDRLTLAMDRQFRKGEAGIGASLTQGDLNRGVGFSQIEGDAIGDEDGDGVFYEAGAYHIVMSGPGVVPRLNAPWNFDEPFKLHVRGINDNDSIFYDKTETFRFDKVTPNRDCGSRTYLRHVFKLKAYDD